MNNSLEHLPLSRQKHLEHIVHILRDEVEQITRFSDGKKKHCRILKIILFGSHATGKWVNDPAHGYISDYDILVIMNNNDLLEKYHIWHNAEQRISINISIPLNILVHSLEEVNNALAQGQYFFSDIKKQGIELFGIQNKKLADPAVLSANEYKVIAEKHFKQWFDGAAGFLIAYKAVFAESDLKNAAFQLHQATERYFACLLLVLTNYKPNTHNLAQLNALAIQQRQELTEVFPQETRSERRCFQLLKKAYIDARYSEHYEITAEELEWLAQRVQFLQQQVKKVCEEKIAGLSD